ncbi:MAG: phosphohistidine phosphatase SixA [Myxococcota bacterium]
MRELWLMRHGHAAPEDHRGDAARPLTPTGSHGVEQLARALSRMGLRVDAVWHSPYRRAVETAAIVATTVGCAQLLTQDEFTPHGSPAQVSRVLASSSVRRLLVVSHLPLLPAVCAELLGVPLRLDVTPGSVVQLSLVGSGAARGAAVLSGFFPAEAMACFGD